MSIVTIVIRRSDNLWNLIDAEGKVSQFCWREVAVAAAYDLLRTQPGMIEVFDEHGRLLDSIDLRTHDPRR